MVRQKSYLDGLVCKGGQGQWGRVVEQKAS